MTPDEHYREAERLLARADQMSNFGETRAQILATAQVHATLATIYRSTERLTS